MAKSKAFQAEVVQQIVEAPPDTVYAFARRMKNLPKWASGLAAGVIKERGEWFTASPMGRVKVAMARKNSLRVLDHDVTLPDGQIVHNAFRVTPVGEASLLTFIVLRTPGTSAAAFRKDVAHVAGDLKALKKVLEKATA